MNVTVNSQVLATELRALNKVVPTKPAIAILSYALLRADDKLHLYATDLEVGLNTECAAHVDVPGTIVLPVAKFLAMVEQFPDADVTLTADGDKVLVRCNAFRSKLQALPKEGFPVQPTVEGEACTLDALALRALIGKTRYAISATAAKYVLQGALLTLAGPMGTMVTTDSKRLAIAMMGRTGADQRIVVPMKTLDLLASQSDVGDVTLTVGPRHLFFASAGRLLISRAIDGQFPKYDSIVPRDNDKLIVADRSALAAALRRVILAAEESQAVYFDITPGQLLLSSSSAEVGSADEVVPVDTAITLKICINGSYVHDFLSVALDQTVAFKLKDEKSAMLMSDGNDHVGVVMLMRG